MQFKSFMEALKGKQHKIDKNKNGKIDAHDFKLLQKEEQGVAEGLVKDIKRLATGKDVKSRAGQEIAKSQDASMKGDHKTSKKHFDRYDKLDKLANKEQEITEATVKTQKYSWGTMKTIHHGSSFSIPLHPEHHQAIAKLKDQQEHKFKTEDGKHWTAKKSGEDVHFQSANDGPKTTVKHNDLKESEDRMARADYKTSPSGRKSHKEIVFNSGEETEKKDKIDEAFINGREYASHGLMHPDHAAHAVHKVTGNTVDFYAHGSGDKVSGKVTKNDGKAVHIKDNNGKTHQFKVTSNLPKKVDESKEEDPPFDGPYTKTTPVKNSDGTTQSPMSRARELAKKAIAASNKKTNEEVEQIDELSKSTLGSYAKKATRDSTITRKIASDFEHMSDRARTPGMKQAAGMNAQRYKEKSWKRRDGLDKAVDRLTKEETVYEAKDEQEYGYEGDMALNQLATLTRCAEMIKETLKPDTDLPEWVQSKITLATDYIQTAADYMHSELEEQAPVAPTLDRKYIRGTPEHKAYKATKKPINGHPTNKTNEEVELEEKMSDSQKYAVKALLKAKHGKETPTTTQAKKAIGFVKTNEGTTMPISYKDFLQINEIKMSELPSRMVKGHSYGATYDDPEGADDYDDKKPVKTAPEKRGRGRPAGAQSGARKNLGNSKLHSK